MNEDQRRPIVVCEPIQVGPAHAPFNAGLLMVISAAWPGRIEFWAEPEHSACVRELLPSATSERFTFATHTPPPRHQPAHSRVGRDGVEAWKIVRNAVAVGARKLVLSCGLPGTVIGAKLGLASVVPSRRPEAHVVMHSVLADVWGWRSRNPLRCAIDMTGALHWPTPSGFRLIILEISIADELIRKLPAIASQIIVLEHPIAETLHQPGARRPGPLRVGFLGGASRIKGFDRYCALARMVAMRGGGAAFHVIGKSEPGAVTESDMAPLASRPQYVPLDRPKFIERLLELDLVIMLHDTEFYAHTPSGVLLDALAAERPVLSLPNPLIDSLVARYGPIGPRVANLEAAAEAIAHLDVATLDQPEFSRYRANLRRAAESRRPAVLATAYAQDEKVADNGY